MIDVKALGRRIGALACVLAAALAAPARLHAATPSGTLITNTVAVDGRDANGNPVPRVEASVSTLVSDGPLLTLTKTADPDPATLGGALSYTLVLGNVGIAPATSVTLTDHLSRHVVYVSSSPAGLFTPGPPDGGTVTWSLGDIPAGGSVTLTLSVTVRTPADYPPGDPDPIADGTLVSNTADALSDEGATAAVSINTTVFGTPLLEATKTASPDQVPAGGTVTYTLTWRNPGTAPATGGRLEDPLPAGTTLVPGSITGGGSLQGGSVVWDLGPLAAGTEGTVSFAVTIPADAVPGSTVRNSCSLLADGLAPVLSNETVTTVPAAYLLTLANVVQPEVTRPGGKLTFTITVTNASTVPLTNVVVTTPVPEDTSFVRADNGGALRSRARAGKRASRARGTVTWNVGTMAAGASVELHLVVRVSPTVRKGAWITDTAYARGDLTAEATASARARVLSATPVMNLVKTAPEAPATAGDEVTFTIRVANRSAVPLTKVVVRDPLPPKTSFVSADGGGVLIEDRVVWRIGDLAPGEVRELHLTLLTDPDLKRDRTLRNEATADCAELAPKTAEAAVEVLSLVPALGLTKRAEPERVERGGEVAFIIRVQNNGHVPLNNISVRDRVPEGLEFVSASDGGVLDGRRVLWTIPLLGPGEAERLRLVCRLEASVPDGREILNVVRATSDETAEVSASAVAAVGRPRGGGGGTPEPEPEPARLTAVKTASPTTASPGDLVRFRIVVRNEGGLPVRWVRVDDFLPDGLALVDGSSRVNGAPATVVGSPAGRTVSWQVGHLDPGAEAVVEFTAAVAPWARPGDLVNVALGAGDGPVTSERASCAVAVTDGVFTDRGTILGSVFVDGDGDGLRDGPGDPGVRGAVLFMEDGTRVVTDADGKFSIADVTPGTRVLRLDETTLPTDLAPVAAGSRFAGDGSSRFVDLAAGGLVTADFPLARRLAPIPPEIARLLPPGDWRPVRLLPAGPAPSPSPAAKASWKDSVASLDPALGFLHPVEGAAVGEQTRVAVKFPLGAQVRLLVNGREVDDGRVGTRVTSPANGVAVHEYIGVPLEPGESNLLTAELRDGFGNVRGKSELRVTAAGLPAGIVLSPARDEAPADGETVTDVAVRVVDRNGNPVPYPVTLTVSLSAGEPAAEDADPVTPGPQVHLESGRGSFGVRSPRQSARAEIGASAAGVTGTASLFFAPHLRPLMVVGVGEAVLGLGSGEAKGNPDNRWYEDGTFTGGRGAFFAQGDVGRGVRLTASYDSGKDERDLFQAEEDDVRSDRQYPVYGDESSVSREALSQDKFYVRLEKGASFAQWGDFKTGLGGTGLAAYDRSLTGFSSTLEGGWFGLRAFASSTAQEQVLDNLPGRGVSGFYRLSFTPVVAGSETVAAETRDRLAPDNVLSRTELARGADYTIDYLAGTILLKEPIPSHDENLDPVFLVVRYETLGGGEENLVYGGRLALIPSSRLEVGLSGVSEERDLGEYRILAADATLRLRGSTVVTGVWATSETDDEAMGEPGDGSAWSLEATSEPVAGLKLAGRYRRVGRGFDNPSSSEDQAGTRNYDLEASWEPVGGLLFRARYLDERDDANDQWHRYGALDVSRKFGPVTLLAGLVREESNDSYIPPGEEDSRYPFDISEDTAEDSTMARLVLEAPLTKDLSFTAEHRQDLDGSRALSRAGLSWQVTPGIRLYAREEYGEFDDRTGSMTVMGAESALGKDTTAFNEYRLAGGADGSRIQNSIGLRNRFSLGKGLTGSVTAENLSTVSGREKEGEPDAFAATAAFEYLPLEKLKLTARVEHRREEGDDGGRAWLGEAGAALRLSGPLTLLARERYAVDDIGGAEAVLSRATLGLAWRPPDSDRFRGLARVEHLRERDELIDPDIDTTAWVASVEGAWRLTPGLETTAKYAGKLAEDDGETAYTDLVAGKVRLDLTDRVDLGLTYRLLRSDDTGETRHGGAVEVGLRVIENFWLSAGYSFDRFDADLTGESFTGEGPYLRLRFKFDERFLRKLRADKQPDAPAAEAP